MRISLYIIIYYMSYIKITFSETNEVQTTFKTIATSSGSPAGNRSAQFLNFIKEDLRKNNDDYAEAIPQKLSNPYLNTTIRASTHNIHPGKPNALMKNNKFFFKKDKTYRQSLNYYDTRRRAFNDVSQNSEEEANLTKPQTESEPPATDSAGMFTKGSPRAPAAAGAPLTFKGFISDKYPKTVNKDKIGKVKKFLDKNMSLLKDFISNKHMKMQTVSMRADQSAEDVELRVKPRFSDDKSEGLVLPNSEQLDMAPAKGARINILRVKGKLCARNVMVPEGPKYDSKGAPYLAPRAPLAPPFARTRPPALLLPRCCNCCRKSVLGCE